MKRTDFVVGVLGVATNATVNFFEQWSKIFPAEKEWDRPRIVIDNNCTMPSRVRALLYNENVELLVEQMTASIKSLIGAGAVKILIACNTAHVFLDNICEKFPPAKNFIVDIVDECAVHLQNRGVKKIFLIASEGTILAGIYERRLRARGIECISPPPEEFHIMRSFIEAVKQDKCTPDIKNLFVDYIRRNGSENVILGCTELPVLCDKCRDRLGDVNFFDPMIIVLESLRETYERIPKEELYGKSLARTLEQPPHKF